MRFSPITFGISCLLSLVVATQPVELEFVPRHVWDPHLQKRQDPAEPANVTLLDHEELVWTTPNNTDKHTTVSMIVWTRQDELIIDMARFAFQLKSVNCTSNMTLQFYHKKAYDAAIKQWEWVNFNDIRSFVMIADHLKCGKNWSLDPWVVSNARYDEKKLVVSLDARKKTWKQVTNSYTVDFGETERTRDLKRWLDFDLSKAFTIPLTTKFPTKIFAQKWANADFAVNCVDCGTSGGLTFAGHIEGSPFGGVDVLTVSVTPDNIQANLGLEVSFGGSYNFSGKSDAKREFELLEIPLPSSWSIPGILHFGPKAKVIAGYELESISGRASVSTGITATIPSDSIAKVEIFGNRKLDVHGWIPTFQTKPLTIEAEITIEAELYAGIAVAVSLEILDDTGINLDLNLKFPELEVTARGGYDPNGFCPNNNNPFGVELNVALGAEIELVAWDEIDGKRHNIFEVDLYENEEIYKFPPLCISFGSQTPGSCAVTPDVEDEEDLPSKAKRSGYIGGPTGMMSRSPQAIDPPVSVFARARKYYMDCDSTSKNWVILTKDYWGPSQIIKKKEAGVTGGVPVLYPLLSCADTSPEDCQPEKWQVKEIRTVDDDDDADDDDSDADADGVINDAGARLSVGSWASEHVYEGNWVRNYFDYLHKNHFQDKSSADRCKYIAETIVKIGTSGGIEDQLMSNIGTKETYKSTMVLLTQKENDYKYRYFDGKPNTAIDASLRDSKFALGPATCALGRVLNTCKYMEHARTQEYMKNTLRGLDKVLTAFDGSRDPNDGGPDSYRAAHEKFFLDQYSAGITKGRAAIADYAQKVTQLDGFANLVQPLKDDIFNKLAVPSEVAKICHPDDFVYPTT